jgi:acetyl-CoA synthetase
VSEAAIVGYRNDIKGQGIFAYVTLVGRITVGGAEKKSWSGVRKKIGPMARRTSSNSF